MSGIVGNGAVNSGLAFSIDSASKKSFSKNVYTHPLGIYYKVYTATNNNCTISPDYGVTDSPVGGVPMKMVITGNDPNVSAYNFPEWNIAPASSGQTWTFSVYLKASVATTCELLILGADSLGKCFNLGAPATSDLGVGEVSIGKSWQRRSFTFTFTNAYVTYIQIRMDGTQTGGSGNIIWWDGLQVERGTLSDFSRITNTDGVRWNDLVSNSIYGTLTNDPTYSNDGLNFNGTNASVVFQTQSIDFTGGGTIEAVFKSSDMATRQQGVMTFNYSGGLGYLNFWLPGNSKVRFELIGTTGSSFTPGFHSTATFANSTWIHAVATWTSSGLCTPLPKRNPRYSGSRNKLLQ